MTKTNFNSVAKEVYEANKLKGFDVANENIGQTLMLIVSELAEALEADRKGRNANPHFFEIDCNTGSDVVPFQERLKQSFESNIKDTFEDEIADTFIRLFDLCGGLGIDIDFHIEKKREYNATREHKHGKKY
jgi:NTP pyrophosphatase (non-canonical NTP hydrolase)